jgi:hypothetical protein
MYSNNRRRASVTSRNGSYRGDGDDSEAAFAGGAYDFALRPEEDDEDEDNEVVADQPKATNADGFPRQRQRKSSFQPLGALELWWMTASAALVLGLTAAAIVLSVVG